MVWLIRFSILSLGILLISSLFPPSLHALEKLTEEELDQVYAKGFMIRLTLDLVSDDFVSLLDPLGGPLLSQVDTFFGNGDSNDGDPLSLSPAEDLSSLLTDLLTTPGDRVNLADIDFLQSIGGNAFQNTRNLFNVASLGDVGVGINLFVFIGDLVNSSLQHQSNSLNFMNLFSDLKLP